MPKPVLNVILVVWALLVFGSLIFAYAAPAGDTLAERAMNRIEIFLIWQGAALVLALVAAFFTWRAREPRGSQAWWTGFGPLIGNGFIAAFVLLAVLSTRLF